MRNHWKLVLTAALFIGVSGGNAAAQEAPAEPPAEAPTQPPTEAPAEAPASPETPPTLTPPSLVHSPPPVYPPAREAEGLHPSVVVDVVLGADGAVLEARVEHSAGEDFDEAAIEAVQGWRFAPARRGDVPIASRVRVSVHFDLPGFDLGTPELPRETIAIVPEEREPPSGPGAHPEYEARADVAATRLRAEERSASDVRVERDVLEAAPRRDAADLLATAPGIFVARPEGGAVAHRIMLRGFDAEHGQDLELSYGGVPINQPSHLHGQGYADLGFLIPEVVHSVRVVEGVYDPRQGDFAVAGSADFELGVAERGLRYESSAGSFRTFRQLAIWAPRDEDIDTFAAAVFEQTAGFGAARAGRSGAVLVQQSFGNRPFRFRLVGSFHAARSSFAGVVRADDVEDGVVGLYGVYDDPSARAQSAATMRAQLALQGERRGANGQNSEVGVWVLAQTFRIAENFTGYTRRSETNPAWIGRGDLIEQQNRDFAAGLSARHRSEELSAFGFLRGHVELGATARIDKIAQAQTLLEVPSNQTWDELVDAKILALDIGVYADLDLRLGDRVTFRGGARADLLAYEVDDRLGNRVPAYRRDDHILGYRRNALGVAAGPRLSLDVKALDALHFVVAYGEGYRSPQARTLADAEPAPFTKVRSVDAGARLDLGAPFQLAVSGFYTRLSDDAVFDAEEGRLERVGATARLGVTARVVTHPLPWLVGAASVTYVRATLLEPPPATVDEPNPPYRDGQALPFVPPWVGRIDLGAHHELATLRRARLEGDVGAGLQVVGRRPLPFDQASERFALLDAQAGLRFAFERGRAVTLGLSATNLAGVRYGASEYYFSSSWDPSAAPSRVPARHLAAGAPRSILVSLGATL